MAAVALPVTTAVIATLLGAAPTQEFERDPSSLPKPEFGKAEPFTPRHKQVSDPTRKAADTTRARADRPIDWPDAATSRVAVPPQAKTAAKAGSLPVSIGRPRSAKAAKGATARSSTHAQAPAAAPSKAEVTFLDRAKTAELGIDGVVLSVRRADGETDPSKLSLALDYSGFAHAYSGNWSSRLRLVQLPACALTTPEKAACRTTTPVASSNDTADQTLTAEVSTAKPAAKARSGTAAFTVLAASAGTSSSQGTYDATPLSPSATWAGGGSNGDFTWSYPMDPVPAPAGPTPPLSIGYSAQSVDGRTSATSAQPSWIGEGFDLPTSYIERSYGSCDDDGQDKKNDQCWKEDNASIVLNGKSSTLILKDKKTNLWRLQGDDGERVIRSTGATNGDDDGEHWTVTTTDGTQYVFGKNRLPGWATGKAETNSVWTVPVFGDDSGEPGYDAGTSFASRAKTQAWRWNLDYVVDPRGNVMTYWYDKEVNFYAKNGTTGNGTEYVRGGYLKRIDYGQRSDTVYSTTQPAAARVKFTVNERCIPVSGGETCANLGKSNRNAWPDVPFDQICKKDTVCTDQSAPSFFSRMRLTGITTQVYDGSGTGADTDYRDVNHWALEHSFPDPGDGSNAGLWLKSIQHTGRVGTAVTLPAITFSGVQMHNRVDKTGDDVPPFIKWRVRTVTSETGSVLTVNYSDPECVAGVGVPELDKNTKRCYPVKWIPPSNPTPGTDPQPRTDWFHKYVVTQVSESDPTGGAPLKQTDYTYTGGGAWAYDDQSPITPAKYRTWGIWRGYPKVTTTTGESAGTRSRSTSLYYRGMHGDKRLDGTTRKETVTDSKGSSVDDEEQYAGQVRETITYNGTAGEEVSGTITTPWSRETASTTHSYGTVRAFMTRTAKEVTRTPVPGDGAITSTTATTYDTENGQPLTVETEGGGQKDCTRTEYVKNTEDWLISYAKRTEKVSIGCSATPNRTGDPKTTDVISDVRTSYDGKVYGTAPIRGDVTATQRVTGYSAGAAQVQTVSTAAYDALGRLTDQWNADGTRTNHIEYTPAAGGPLTAKKEVNALGHTISTEVAPDWGSNTVHTDPNGKRTESAYDGLGRLTDVWPADRNRAGGQAPSTKYEYKIQKADGSWVATKTLNNDGSTYQTSYAIFDALLRPRQTQAPAAVGSGRVIADTKYDTRGLGIESSADYIDTTAPSGKLATLLTASPAGKRMVYDGAERPVVEINLALEKEHSRTTTTYEGNATTVEPPTGAPAVREEVDSRGRLAEKREYDGKKATGDYTRLTYAYGRADQLTKVQDNDGNTWTYEYDFLGRQTKSVDPDTGVSRKEYDQLDQVAVTEDARGNLLSQTYDVLGRQTGRLTGRIPVVDGKPSIDDSKYLARWSYDTIALGQPTSSIRYEGGKNGKVYALTSAAYDSLYRVLKEQFTISTSEGAVAGTGTYTFTNAYNLDGTLQKRTLPAMGGLGQEVLTYGYNDQRMPTTLQGLTGIVRGTDYLPAGERTRITLGVSSTAKWTEINSAYEDGTKRLARQTVVSESNKSTDADTYFRYDAAGNPVEIDDRSTALGDKQCFTYDGHRRLRSAWTAKTDCATAPSAASVGGVAAYWKSFAYDTAGNRKSATDHLAAGGAATTAYAYDHTSGDKARPHLLASTTTSGGNKPAAASSYTYDEAGNTRTRTIGENTQRLDWGPENNLAKVTEANAAETTFLNDADGNRLIRRDVAGTTLQLGETELRQDKATGKVEATRYYSHAGQVVAMRTSKSLTWTSSDHNGTANVQIDAASQAVIRRSMQPFGETRGAAPASWIGEKGFAGGTEDPTGLTHLGAREYDPAIGRFVSADPIADLKDPQQINGYAYSNNNPVTFADADGKFFFSFIKALITVAVAIVTYIAAASHVTHRQRSSSRASRGGSRAGLAASGSAVHTSAASSAPSCPAIQRQYGICNNKEPENPKSLGQLAKDMAGAAGAFLVGTADGIEYLTEPWCWAGADCGLRKSYMEKAKEHGVEVDSKEFKGTENALDIASIAAGGWGAVRAFIKRGLKGGTKQADVPQGKPNPDCKCFLAGTLVLMADGSTKPIEDVDVGDTVMATDPEEGESGPRKVSHLIRTPKTSKKLNKLAVSTEDGVEQLTATHEHPFWSPSEHAWLVAGALLPGMTLLTDQGETVSVKVNTSFTKQTRTYNLTVDDLHTYYVLAGRTPVLVHNSNCPEGYTSSPALKGDPYHPDSTAARSAQNRELYAGTVGDRAGALGYRTRIPAQKAPFNSHGQVVFSNGKNYITPDVDGHNVSDGWKMFNRKGQRIGTYDPDLNYLKE
ncbi:RHS repeat-associated core domain-containing protein [Streptomyces lichenis]|uniref:Polymorphic toxin-type HINT domain-containing protein n=1 Tax=Streptomyces lichenis TaxID=2306967 RepID=A0ABT0IBC9_9ACTN|nr:RHS repeat-associated core domain-containing protein [Streptomyces lichenis]MCK8678615.1 polymorphic toxin-type HINT domain-containing protein [Streptomyces lichenis]